MKKKIVLIGMMGSGKTTIGRVLSKILEFDFIDTDLLIEKSCKKKISQIFYKNHMASCLGLGSCDF